MQGWQLEGVSLVWADLSGATIISGRFDGADLTQANLDDVSLLGIAGGGLVPSFSDAVLASATLVGVMGTADFISADLTGANCSAPTSSTAVSVWRLLFEPNLTDAVLDCSFDNADLTGAITARADFTGSTWDGAICPDGTTASGTPATCDGHL